MVRPSQRREMAVRYRSAGIALGCGAFSIGERCYRYRPRLSDENALIADWPVALTNAKKTRGLDLCFPHLRNVRFWRNRKRFIASTHLSCRAEHADQARETAATGEA